MMPTTHKRAGRRALRIILTVAAVFTAVFLFRGFIARALAVVQRPLSVAGTWVTDRTFGVFAPSIESADRITRLEAERNALAVDFAELEQLRDENAQLRDQLAFADRTELRTVTAAVIARAGAQRPTSFVIDRGSDDGVRLGAPVVVGNGVLAGKVSAVGLATATVTTITDPSIATAATLLNETRTIGLAEGMDGRLLRLALIPQDETIAVNDLIITSGLEEGVPSGLLIGIVNAVHTDRREPFQEAIVEPLVDIRRHASVSVIVE